MKRTKNSNTIWTKLTSKHFVRADGRALVIHEGLNKWRAFILMPMTGWGAADRTFRTLHEAAADANAGCNKHLRQWAVEASRTDLEKTYTKLGKNVFVRADGRAAVVHHGPGNWNAYALLPQSGWGKSSSRFRTLKDAARDANAGAGKLAGIFSIQLESIAA